MFPLTIYGFYSIMNQVIWGKTLHIIEFPGVAVKVNFDDHVPDFSFQ